MNANTYPIIAAAIFLVGLVWAVLSRPKVGAPLKKRAALTFGLTLLFCLGFSLTFESSGAISSSFALCMTLWVIWSGRNIFRLADFAQCVAVSFACSAGIWLVFERIFSLSLP